MRRAIFILAAYGMGAAQPAQAQQYSDEQIAQALLSTSWCTSSYSQTSGRERRQRATFDSSGVLQIANMSEGVSSGPNGSVYSNSNGADVYRWGVQNGQLVLANEEGTQALTLGESRNSSGGFILVVDGTEWWPC